MFRSALGSALSDHFREGLSRRRGGLITANVRPCSVALRSEPLGKVLDGPGQLGETLALLLHRLPQLREFRVRLAGRPLEAGDNALLQPFQRGLMRLAELQQAFDPHSLPLHGGGDAGE